MALTHVCVSPGSPWLLYRVGDHRSHHVQRATTAVVSLAWCNDAESGITFSRSYDERRGILSALHQSRAIQILTWRAKESKPTRAKRLVWVAGILKSKFSERQTVDRRRKDHDGYHDFCRLYMRAKER